MSNTHPYQLQLEISQKSAKEILNKLFGMSAKVELRMSADDINQYQVIIDDKESGYWFDIEQNQWRFFAEHIAGKCP